MSSNPKTPAAQTMAMDASAAADDDDVTASAYKTITEHLESWASPHVGTLDSQQQQQQPYKYERDAMDWWNRELVDPTPDDEDDDDATPATVTTPTTTTGLMRLRRPTARSPTATPGRQLVERATTPIMSNSSSNKKRGVGIESTAAVGKGTRTSTPLAVGVQDDDDAMPLPVESPWVQSAAYRTPAPVQTPAPMSSRRFRTSTSNTSSTLRAISPFRSAQYENRRYHDALLTFLKQRRSLSDRIAIDQQERALHMETTNNALADLNTVAPGSGVDPALVQEEMMVELDFLRTLKIISWEREPPCIAAANSTKANIAVRREGNFWALLHELRKLGIAALLWADDEPSQRQYAQAEAAYLEEMASQALYFSPNELLQEALMDDSRSASSSIPLRLKRRRQLLQWMEQCFEPLVNPETKAAVNSGFVRQQQDTSGATSVEPKILKGCLSLIFAGRLEDALQLLRNAGDHFLAASWGGGAPPGFSKVVNEQDHTVSRIPIGNVHRPLWKRSLWKLSQLSNSAVATTTNPTDEAAITAILAGDFQNALRHPSLRTWERGLYVLVYSSWERTKEELWHLHNNQRRQHVRPPFPGTQYQQVERDQLQATSLLGNATETRLLNLLSASPFEQMQGRDVMCGATAAVLIGRTAITDFLHAETDFILNLDEKYGGIPEEDVMQQLRFMTHWLLFLDSMLACTTPVHLEGVQECKQKVLFCYVDHLASHEDLWPLVVLYASLLETSLLLDYFPKVLARVQGQTQRQAMLLEARELLPRVGLDLLLLRSTLQLILTEEEDDMSAAAADTDTPTRADIRKMKSLHWLCMYEEHYGDALMAANQLLRSFLLANKISSAIMFLQDFLPLEVVEQVMTCTIEPPKIDIVDDAEQERNRYLDRLAEARSEHQSINSFLRACRSVEEWRLVLSSTPVTQTLVDDQVDTTVLNEREKEIATAMERRELIKQNRKVSDLVVQAAMTAHNNSMAVLEHPGGWLSTEDGVENNPFANDPDAKRREEIRTLRSKLLPQTVSFFHEVCDQTATWMAQSLENAVPALGTSFKDVLEALVDDPEADLSSSPLSPKYWTREALDLAETVVADEHDIMSALDASDLKEVLEVFAEIALKDLMYTV